MTEVLPQIQKDADGRVIYRPDGKTLVEFMRDDSRVRIIRGPIRSGTSSMCCMEIWRRACEQRPGPDGLRRSRWAIVRNTYPDLQMSTIKTWLGWFPEGDFGRFIWSKPMVHTLRKGDVMLEVIFLALDKADDVGKLRSTEWTGIWFNELEYIPKEVFDEAESRVGYYPAIKDGGASWAGVIGDMNAPSEDNWVVALTGEVAPPEELSEADRGAYVWPEGWRYFRQPPGLVEVFGADRKTVVGYELNKEAENLTWIPRVNGKPLYLETIKGKSKRWIDSRIMNRITPPVGGQPVWSMFVEENHVALQSIRWRPEYPIYVGMDFGRQPAVVLGQRINDRWMIIDEMTGFDMGATTFAPKVIRWWSEKYPDAKFIVHGDPKGADKNQSDEQSAFDVWRANGVNVMPAPVKGNNIKTRLEVVEHALQAMPNGYVGFLVSPVCRVLKMALSGGYRFKEGDNIREEPDKNKYSHCFVGETLVSTPNGAQRIDAIRVGDMVDTDLGPRRVTAEMSRDVTDLIEVLLVDGRKIVCTPDHPFAVSTGFCRADALQYGDILFEEGTPWVGRSSTPAKISTESGTTGKSRGISGLIQRWAASGCTVPSGARPMGRSLMGCTSITEMAIGRITGSKIWRSCLQAITLGCTWLSGLKPIVISGVTAWPRPGRLRLSGTEAMPGGNGIASMGFSSPHKCMSRGTTALGAGANTRSSAGGESAGSAECHAKGWQGALRALMMWTGFVLPAVPGSGQTNTPKSKRAAVVARVSSHQQSGMVRVYDLTVDGSHTFYANGVLVSNCADALQYLLLGGGEGRVMVGAERERRTAPTPARMQRRSLRRVA